MDTWACERVKLAIEEIVRVCVLGSERFSVGMGEWVCVLPYNIISDGWQVGVVRGSEGYNTLIEYGGNIHRVPRKRI